jgi:cytoskeletal protein RodZ
MHSEQWSERLQFCFMTYCWDATDVGLLVIAILLVIWLTGLLWLARMSARQQGTQGSNNNESQNGAEYNGNAEFDDFSTEGNPWSLIFQWWWWGLGFVLLVRILGPFAVQNLNNRRRQRRRRRFESDNRQQHTQQAYSTSISDGLDVDVDDDYGNIENKHDADDSITGVEIMPTNTTPPRSAASSREPSSSPVRGLEIT